MSSYRKWQKARMALGAVLMGAFGIWYLSQAAGGSFVSWIVWVFGGFWIVAAAWCAWRFFRPGPELTGRSRWAPTAGTLGSMAVVFALLSIWFELDREEWCNAFRCTGGPEMAAVFGWSVAGVAGLVACWWAYPKLRPKTTKSGPHPEG